MKQGNRPKERGFALHTDHLDSGERIRIGVEGEMDLSVVDLVDREMERAEATEASRIVLDLDQVEFMDASGVRLLLDVNARSDGDGRRLRITSGSPQVRRVLELTGTSELLPIEG
jgi:stage II sporulation protein AA (anti-sigma F factor antagonist)